MPKREYLPKNFKKYFWDVDFKQISSYPFSKFVIERVMNFGDFKALCWLLRTVPKKVIKDIVKNSRQLDNKTRNFWRLIYAK